MKGVLDVPVDTKSVAREFKLDCDRLYFNEHQVLVSLGFSLYFKESDLVLPDDEAADIAFQDEQCRKAGVPFQNRRRGSLTDIFPLEGLLSLTYSSEKPQLPSVTKAYLQQVKPQHYVPLNASPAPLRNSMRESSSPECTPNAVSSDSDSDVADSHHRYYSHLPNTTPTQFEKTPYDDGMGVTDSTGAVLDPFAFATNPCNQFEAEVDAATNPFASFSDPTPTIAPQPVPSATPTDEALARVLLDSMRIRSEQERLHKLTQQYLTDAGVPSASSGLVTHAPSANAPAHTHAFPPNTVHPVLMSTIGHNNPAFRYAPIHIYA